VGKLSDIIEKDFGLKTIYQRNHMVNALAIGETQFLRANDDRLAFIVVNLGANNAYILPEPGVLATNGIVLTANGGHYIGKYNEDFIMTGNNWFGIAPLGAVNILCLEVIGR